MRQAAVLLVACGVAACSASPVDVRPEPGHEIGYVQTFRVTDRASGGEELPSVTIVRRVRVTCEAADDAGSRFAISNGNVSVWIDDDTGAADFVAADTGAAARAFDEVETDLATMYAALWATTAHLGGTVTVDRRGTVTDWVGALDDERRARSDDPSADLGGSFLESLVDDPSLLFPANDEQGRRTLRFRLAHWKASFHVAADVDVGEAGRHTLAYESRSGDERDGPFLNLTLRISGDAEQDPATGLLEAARLAIDVSADVPTGPSGTTRADGAVVEYTLSRIDR